MEETDEEEIDLVIEEDPSDVAEPEQMASQTENIDNARLFQSS